MRKKSVRDIEVGGKRVLMRADFNVTVEDGRINRRQPHPRRHSHHPLPSGAGGAGHTVLSPGTARRQGGGGHATDPGAPSPV